MLNAFKMFNIHFKDFQGHVPTDQIKKHSSADIL